jgi:uncharacterized RDD family membrane protein YckC
MNPSADRAESDPLQQGRAARQVGEGVGLYFADVPNRLVASALDAIVLSALAFVAALIISFVFGPVVTFDAAADPVISVDRGLALADVAVTTGISAVYFVASWRRGASPGHRVLGMRIWDDDSWHRITARQGIIRWLFIGVPLGLQGAASVVLDGRGDSVLLTIVFAWYITLVISTARNPKKQGLHDRAAGTVVTKRARQVPHDAPDAA